MPIFSYKIRIAYEGTGYSGWQIQSNSLSIQHLVQQAISTVTRENVKVIGSSRTDAGVHALGQIAHFQTGLHITNANKFLISVNALLPFAIRVLEIEQVPENFHACYSAKRKLYHYRFSTGLFQNPFDRAFSLHIRRKLDLEKIQIGAQIFVGEHDFSSFANTGRITKDNIRTIYRIELVQEKEDQYHLAYEGNGFLYKMVRNLTGVILDIGYGKTTLLEAKKILKNKDRTSASKAVEPHGLFLVKVLY